MQKRVWFLKKDYDYKEREWGDVVLKEGNFIMWGDRTYEDGGHETCALISLDDGTVETVYPEYVQFQIPGKPCVLMSKKGEENEGEKSRN